MCFLSTRIIYRSDLYFNTTTINIYTPTVEEVIKLYNKWDKKTFSRLGNMRGYSYPNVTQTKEESEESVVWVTFGGSKYHNNPNCSKMRSPIKMDLLQAIEKGYEPCGKCYK